MLDQIINQKIKEVNRLKQKTDIASLINKVEKMPPAKSLSKALTNPYRMALLAEVKKASPSKGIIRKDFEPCRIAKLYTLNGADGISVLTDQKFFQGSLSYLKQIRQVTHLPLLRKDFIIDPIQVYQSRLYGADAVLLICAILTPKTLSLLMETAKKAGLEALVEVHNSKELGLALSLGAGFIGINNRNLKTFEIDLNVSHRLCRKIKDTSIVVVSESGISTTREMEYLFKSGINAALIGEALVSANNIGSKVRELSGRQWGLFP